MVDTAFIRLMVYPLRSLVIGYYVVYFIILSGVLINPFKTNQYDGGDVLTTHLEINVLIGILSLLLILFNKKNRNAWVLSVILALINILIIYPILFIYMFFGIPFIN